MSSIQNFGSWMENAKSILTTVLLDEEGMRLDTYRCASKSRLGLDADCAANCLAASSELACR
jgi:hypothetical protein